MAPCAKRAVSSFLMLAGWTEASPSLAQASHSWHSRSPREAFIRRYGRLMRDASPDVRPVRSRGQARDRVHTGRRHRDDPEAADGAGARPPRQAGQSMSSWIVPATLTRRR